MPLIASIDLESSGLDAERCSITEIGIVVEDTANPKPLDQIPTFHRTILYTGIGLYWEMGALLLESGQAYQKRAKAYQDYRASIRNNYSWDEYCQHLDRFCRANKLFICSGGDGNLSALFTQARDFLVTCGFPEKKGSVEIIAAGKNFTTFDLKFLTKHPAYNELIRGGRRCIDPAAFFVDWKTDSKLPSLQECLDKAKIEHTINHDALDDAMAVVKLLRTQYSS